MNGLTFGVSMFALVFGSAPGHPDPGYAAPAQVQSYRGYPGYTRYCKDTSFGRTGPVTICMYETLAQCQASRARQSERCFLNPAFANEGPRRNRRGG